VELSSPDRYTEGPWFFRHGDWYYLAFASHCCPEGIGYAMSRSPTGPWIAKGDIMAGNAKSSGNHPGIVDLNGETYVFGFNYALNFALTSEHRERRSVCVAKMSFNADGTIPEVPWWNDAGVPQVGALNPYVQTEAETIAWSDSVETETCEEGGMDVTNIEDGDSIVVKGVDFRGGATSLDARVASAKAGGSIEVHLDGRTGPLAGTCAVPSTGGWQNWATVACPITGAAGVHDVYFVFGGASGSLLNFNWWKFHGVDAADAGQGADGGMSRDGGGAHDASGVDAGTDDAEGTSNVCDGTCSTERGACTCGVGRSARDPKALLAVLACMGVWSWRRDRGRRRDHRS